MEHNEGNYTAKRPVRKSIRQKPERDRFYTIRNVLNVIFMVMALIGVLIYFFKQAETGTYIVLAAMVFKMVECVLRFIR